MCVCVGGLWGLETPGPGSSCPLAPADSSLCCQSFWFSLLNPDFNAENVGIFMNLLNGNVGN